MLLAAHTGQIIKTNCTVVNLAHSHCQDPFFSIYLTIGVPAPYRLIIMISRFFCMIIDSVKFLDFDIMIANFNRHKNDQEKGLCFLL